MAVKQRWNIDSAFRDVVVERLKTLVESEDEEIAIKAITRVATLVAQNQKDEHKVLDVRISLRHDQIPGIAADLGIEVSAIEDAAREADTSIGDIESEGS